MADALGLGRVLCHGPEPGSTAHTRTIVVLHGFTQHPEHTKRKWLRALSRRCSEEELRSLRLVFPAAPLRKTSCYPGEPELRSWHDYFTDHGGKEGRPELEEEVSLAHMAAVRTQLHALLDAEVAALGDVPSNVALAGVSQGCCTAYDAALSYRRTLGGLVAWIGALYSHTGIVAGRNQLRLCAMHGGNDTVIHASLARAGWARLAAAGFTSLAVRVEPGLGHTSSDPLWDVACGELRSWGFIGADSVDGVSGSAGSAGGVSGRGNVATTCVPPSQALVDGDDSANG